MFQPVRIALIGAGQRAWSIYRPLFSSLKPWIEVVAVCDTRQEHADRMAAALGARAYTDIRALVRDRPMEAALVITPVDSHYAISVYLSLNGIHNLTETSWCRTVAQGKRMTEAAKETGVVARVGENFFRFPVDRIVQAIGRSGFIGPIHRIISYADHTGYHNNSRWTFFAKAHPLWVQGLQHAAPTVHFTSTPQRRHTSENYRWRNFMFPDNFMVVDHAANIKGFLGRHGRPGYTEWQGEAGTIVWKSTEPWEGRGEVWFLRAEDRNHVDEEVDHTHPLQCYPIVEEYEGKNWTRSYVDLPIGRVEYVNPFRPDHPSEHRSSWYGAPVMDHLVGYSQIIRGVAEIDFTPDDALMSLMMDIGADISAENEGKRVSLPLKDEIEGDEIVNRQLRETYGVDPMDWDAMLSYSYPKH